MYVRMYVSSSAKATFLTENDDVPGSKFENEPANYTPVEQLKRWLKCRGLKQAGKREDFLARVNACLKSGNHHILDPGINNGKWLEAKILRIRKPESLEASISDLQIGVRGRLRVRVLTSEHAHFENFRPPNLKRVLSTENSYS